MLKVMNNSSDWTKIFRYSIQHQIRLFYRSVLGHGHLGRSKFGLHGPVLCTLLRFSTIWWPISNFKISFWIEHEEILHTELWKVHGLPVKLINTCVPFLPIHKIFFSFRAIMNFENYNGIMFKGTRLDNCHVIQCGGGSTFVSRGEDRVFRG